MDDIRARQRLLAGLAAWVSVSVGVWTIARNALPAPDLASMHDIYTYAMLLTRTGIGVGAAYGIAAPLLLSWTFRWKGASPLLAVISFPAGLLFGLFIQVLWIHGISHAAGAEVFDSPLTDFASPVPALTFMVGAFVAASLLWPNMKSVLGPSLASYWVFTLGSSIAFGIGWFATLVVPILIERGSAAFPILQGAVMGLTSGVVSGAIGMLLIEGRNRPRRRETPKSFNGDLDKGGSSP